jgi:hypothetical protein
LATSAAGIALGGMGTISAINDIRANHLNICNAFNATTSLLMVALSGWGAANEINNSLRGLSDFSYPDEMLNPSMGHEGYYNGEGPISIQGIGASGGTYPTKELPAFWPQTDQLMQVPYYDAEARAAMEVFVNRNGQLVNASGNVIGSRIMNTRIIAVMDSTGHIYYSDLSSGENIHHSSFLAGGPVAYAGQIEIRNGMVIQIDAMSGHYTPEFPLYNNNLISELSARGVNTTNIISIPGWHR